MIKDLRSCYYAQKRCFESSQNHKARDPWRQQLSNLRHQLPTYLVRIPAEFENKIAS